jgi:thiosulfate/3-mercaptopyruvate sulfurtransferase
MNPRKLVLAAVCLVALGCLAHDNDLPPGSPQLIQPEELAKVLQSSGAQKPIILNVGPHILYVHAHIPGAEYIGMGSKAEDLDKLRERAKSLPHDSLVVIYCGCCPWDRCPNIRPAYQELKKVGFKNLRVLYLADSFGIDWTQKGYPVAKGE